MAQNDIFGILSNYNLKNNLPSILDAIRFTETGGEANPLQAVGSSGEVGAFQLYPKIYKDPRGYGFGVRKDITDADAQDYWKSRGIAKELLQGMKKYRNYDLGQLLAGYNWGSGDVDNWIKSGGQFEDLPDTTQNYLTKVAKKLQENYVDPLRGDQLSQLQGYPESKMLAGAGDISEYRPLPVGNSNIDKVMMAQAQTPKTDNPLWKRFLPVQSAYGQTPTTTSGNTNMNMSNTDLIQERMLHEAVRDGKTTVSPDGYIITEAGEVSGFEFNPNYFGGNQPISINNNVDTAMLNREAYFNQPEGALNQMNQDASVAGGNYDTQPIDTRFSGSYPDQIYPDEKFMRMPNVNDINQSVMGDAYGGFGNTANASTLNNPNLSPALQTYNNNTRQNTPLSSPTTNDLMIGNNEMLMRMAGEGFQNMGQGSTASFGSALGMYGDIKDTNRANMVQLAQSQADAGMSDDDLAQIGKIDETLFDMERSLNNLDTNNLTGWFTGTVGRAWDLFDWSKSSSRREAGRLLLNKLKVDDALLRIAQTKGAISNKEMDLFLSPAPSNFADEDVWKAWIQDRIVALRGVRNRLSTGMSVDPSQQATSGQVNQFSSGNVINKTTPTGVNYSYSTSP